MRESWKFEARSWKQDAGSLKQEASSFALHATDLRLQASRFTLQAFSLLELTAAMAILVVVISILGRIVTDTQRVWRQGADGAQAATTVRAAMAQLDYDLSAAVANSNLVFGLGFVPDGATAYSADQELFFHRLTPQAAPADYRALQQVHVFVSTNATGLLALYRTLRLVPYFGTNNPAYPQHPDPDDGLWSDGWMTSIATNAAAPILLDNVATIRLTVQYPSVSELGVTDGTLERSDTYLSSANDDMLPIVLDLDVALLPERASRRWAGVPEGERNAFLARNAVRYSHRIHLRNREGGLLP